MTRLGKIVVFLIVLIILGVIGFFLARKGTPNLAQPTENVPVNTGMEISPLVTNDATTTYTELHVVYPHSSKTEYPEIFNFVNTTRNDFLNSYGTLTDAEAQAQYMRADDPYQLFITTRIATSTKTVSYILETYQFLGGAHGGTTADTFTYDANHTLVTIDRVFKPGYLKTIADMSRKYFTDTLDSGYINKTMLNEGTVATTTNFSSWYLTDKTVTFIFQQYQIGPYVLGIQEYPIDKSKIQDILQPEFMLQ